MSNHSIYHSLSLLLLISLSCQSSSDLTRPQEVAQPNQVKVNTPAKAENPCLEFDKVNTLVRDGLIDRKEAQNKIRELIPKIRDYFQARGGHNTTPENWIFPVKGYGPKAIGGSNGNGYLPKGYDYFDGNKHGGHPAHDIFINDRNQDELDDTNGKLVEILSMTSGVVVARANEWQPGSELRGGKYIYIYNPATNGLFYYAHNREIFPELGAIVKPGDVIATMGRSGKNAAATRSPTHLHITYLIIEDGYPKPKDLYQALLSAVRK
ncbi:MAG: M23 family metallopeptidase [Acidobacteriota bacterium]